MQAGVLNGWDSLRQAAGPSGTSVNPMQARLVHLSGDEKEALGGHPIRWDEGERCLALSARRLPATKDVQGHTGWRQTWRRSPWGRFRCVRTWKLARAVATRLTSSLDLPRDLADAVVRACEWHDAGKKRSWWQAAIGNADAEPLAKSDEPAFDRDLNAGYRRPSSVHSWTPWMILFWRSTRAGILFST